MTDKTKSSNETAAAPKSKKKIGVSKNPPKSEARPLGTPAPKKQSKKNTGKGTVETTKLIEADIAEISADELVGSRAEEVVDTPASDHVDSSSSIEKTSNETTSIVNTGDVAHSAEDKKIMASISLALDPKTRKSTSVVFKLPAGVRGSVRIAKTAFPGGVPPASLSLQSDQENAFAEAKPKLTAEQRKEARKNAPKLTAAQKLAKLQERAARLQAKIAAGATA